MTVCRTQHTGPRAAQTADRTIDDIVRMITAACGRSGQQKKTLSPALYWRIGKRLRQGQPKAQSPQDTLAIIGRITKKLERTNITIFTQTTFLHTLSFIERFPEYEQIKTLGRNLIWDHYKVLIKIDDHIQRDFYAWMSYIKHWTSRDLKRQINSDLYEKTPSAQVPTNATKHKALSDFESVLMSALVTRDERLLSFPEDEEA